MGKLRDRMEADLRLRNLRPSTQRSYLGCVRTFAAYHMRSPAHMGTNEVRDFLVHLRDERELQPITIKGYVAALKFLYAATLDRPEVVRPWLSPRVVKKLPVVLSGTEVEAVLAAIESITYRAVLMTTYGAGLRISEACLPAQGRGHRQQANADPRPRRQGRQAALHHALQPTARRTAGVLAAAAPRRRLPVPRPEAKLSPERQLGAQGAAPGDQGLLGLTSA